MSHNITAIVFKLKYFNILYFQSIYENELLDNLKIFDFELDNGDMEDIKKLDMNLRKIIPVKKLKDGTMELRDQHSMFYSFDVDETEDCLND